MQTLKLSQNTNSNAFGFIGALLVHASIFFAIFGLHLFETPQILQKESQVVQFSFASFAPAPPPPPPPAPVQEVIEKTPPKISKIYEPPKQKPKEEKKEHKKIQKIKETPKITKQETPQQNPVTTTQITQPTTAQSTNQPVTLGGNTNNPFLATLKQLIDSHNRYPRMAKKMGLKGLVVVRMILEKNGEIKELKIIKSSSHDILDNQSIKAIREASKLFPKPDKDYIVDIPIDYQLENS